MFQIKKTVSPSMSAVNAKWDLTRAPFGFSFIMNFIRFYLLGPK